MKMKNEYVKLPKEMLYEMYLSVVYNCKDYDNITRGKMIDEILKEYEQEEFLYYICTYKELEFLKYAYNHKLTKNDIEKYNWEIRELNNKFIFSRVTFSIYDEQKQNVIKALDKYKNSKQLKKNHDEMMTFIISVVKINANMLTKVLISMISSITSANRDDVNSILGNPLIHYYCDFYNEYFESSNDEEEFIYYRKYYEILDEIDEQRKIYGLAGSIPMDFQDNFDTFYYGFPIGKKKVKKMYDLISKNSLKEFLFDIIDEARALNNRYGLEVLFNGKDLEIVNEALDDMPCAVMNGFTPNQYKEEKLKDIDLDKKLNKIPQNNAHLSKKAADQFYKLYFALLEYTNKKYKISDIKKIYKQEGLDASKLLPINDYLFSNKQIIDEFITDNDYKFNKEELEVIEGFKSAIKSDNFTIIGFEREYTEVLSEDGKIYMVKGIRTDLDKLMDINSIPKVIETTLLMFKENIIFNGFYSSYDNIVFGNDFKEMILEEYNDAIRYYHL